MQYYYSNLIVYAFRIRPHADLKESIRAFATEMKIKAGIIVTAVGSLEQIHLRFANQTSGKIQQGYFEILSLTGTFSESAEHLHLSVGDSNGNIVGGHLLNKNHVYTTVEIAIGCLPSVEFERELDTTYNYKELVIKPAAK